MFPCHPCRPSSPLTVASTVPDLPTVTSNRRESSAEAGAIIFSTSQTASPRLGGMSNCPLLGDRARIPQGSRPRSSQPHPELLAWFPSPGSSLSRVRVSLALAVHQGRPSLGRKQEVRGGQVLMGGVCPAGIASPALRRDKRRAGLVPPPSCVLGQPGSRGSPVPQARCPALHGRKARLRGDLLPWLGHDPSASYPKLPRGSVCLSSSISVPQSFAKQEGSPGVSLHIPVTSITFQV